MNEWIKSGRSSKFGIAVIIVGVLCGILTSLNPAKPFTLTVAEGCAKFSELVGNVTGSGQIVSGISCRGQDGQDIIVTLRMRDNSWQLFDYDERLRFAQSMQSGAVQAGGFNAEPDRAHVDLIGEAGEKLGGSSGIAGSSVDVER